MTAQAMQALALANQIRSAGVAIRREMGALPSAESRRRAAELLRDPPDAIARMRVGYFLSGVHRLGKHRAHEFLFRAGLGLQDERRIGSSDHTGVRTLTDRQREALAMVLVEGLS